ncbi:fluoride efflux transporter CrcB [Saccharopolyspora hirsuta]|uniref:Fluoride-specific ion channel FluC n=1 Tax=Saccharopolyspora hirsuta TaxID=1837 RepID=A0A5M7C3I8_SACHI|nr:fluoride efflux transporter CrcB [Saccharopolyspora hirsuta]KAA5836343.1 fluoride efflux transporter CrcB [Saccharopolyspora hirsuta]
MTFVLVAIGGALGACLRFLTDRWVQARHDTGFPWGTLTVNAVGSLIIGVLTGVALFGVRAPELQALLGVGFCGALTTFSTFGYESVRLLADGARLYAVLNVLGTVLAGIGSGVLGVVLVAAVLA